MVNEIKRKLNAKTIELSEVLEKAFEQEELEYDSIHPSYNSKTKRNDDENLFITCYVEKMKPYGIHIDNRLEENKWVIDLVIMKPKFEEKIKELLKDTNFVLTKYNGECHGEFEGHRKLIELNKDVSYEVIKDINLKLLRIFR